jgi:hypothetical protein
MGRTDDADEGAFACLASRHNPKVRFADFVEKLCR